jgi:hypothetical protein
MHGPAMHGDEAAIHSSCTSSQPISSTGTALVSQYRGMATRFRDSTMSLRNLVSCTCNNSGACATMSNKVPNSALVSLNQFSCSLPSLSRWFLNVFAHVPSTSAGPRYLKKSVSGQNPSDAWVRVGKSRGEAWGANGKHVPHHRRHHALPLRAGLYLLASGRDHAMSTAMSEEGAASLTGLLRT